MTGDQVFRLIQKSAELLMHEQPGRVDFDPGKALGFGETHEFASGPPVFRIGVAGLRGNHTRLGNGEAMLPVGALFHEVCGHGGQLKYEFNKTDDLSTLLALNFYACRSTPSYYDGNAKEGEFTERYARQPHEIAAQYMALVSMRSCLPGLWAEIEDEDGKVVGRTSEARDKKAARYTDRMLCAYTNYRMLRKSEFVHRPFPYLRVDDILESFEVKFLECADAHREYIRTEERYGYVQKQVALNSRVPSLGIPLEKSAYIETCPSGSHQDMMLCAAFREESIQQDHGLEWVLDKPALQAPDLFSSRAFDEIPPWSPPKFGPSPMEKFVNMAERAKQREAAKRAASGVAADLYGRGPPGPGV